MKEISARVTGTLWHYVSNDTDNATASEVIIDELRPSVDNAANVGIDADVKVDLTILLLCEGWLYETKVRNIALGVAQDITTEFITFSDVVAQFDSSDSINKLLSTFGSIEVTDSQRVGLPTEFREDDIDDE